MEKNKLDDKEIWKQTQYFRDTPLEFESVLGKIDMKGKKVLDFGCGNGKDLLECAKRGAICYGVDIVQFNLDNTKKLLANNNYEATLKLIDKNNFFEFEDNFFDIIIASGVLHHIPHANKTIINLNRILKNKGKLYLMLYTSHFFYLNVDKIENMLKNHPSLTWQQCFGEITDKCNYSTFYTVKRVLEDFTSFYTNLNLIKASEYRNNIFMGVEMVKNEN
jgi:ubiquinone/menaquinone biosynthesis C-methylase UbiE